MTEQVSQGSLPRRYAAFVSGVVCMALGVGLMVHAELGVSQISALPLTWSHILPVSFGMATAIMCTIFVLIQKALLRRRFPLVQWLQIPASLLFGGMCDVAVWLFSWLQPDAYWLRLLICVLGVVLVGIGVWLEVTPKVVMIAGEGLVNALSIVLDREFGRVKIGFDVVLVALAVVSGLVFLHEVVGVREGTLIAAVSTGLVVQWMQRHAPGWLRRFVSA